MRSDIQGQLREAMRYAGEEGKKKEQKTEEERGEEGEEINRVSTLTSVPAKSKIFLASAQASRMPCIDAAPLISKGPSKA